MVALEPGAEEVLVDDDGCCCCEPTRAFALACGVLAVKRVASATLRGLLSTAIVCTNFHGFDRLVPFFFHSEKR